MKANNVVFVIVTALFIAMLLVVIKVKDEQLKAMEVKAANWEMLYNMCE